MAAAAMVAAAVRLAGLVAEVRAEVEAGRWAEAGSAAA